MTHILFVFINILLPIFLQIGIGYALNKKFNIHTGTLAKIQFYVFIPALLFTKIYETALDSTLFLRIVGVNVLLFGVIYVLSLVLSRVNRYNKKTKSAFINSICFYNSGNYCIPLVQLLYNTPYAFSIQIIVMLTQNVLTNTFGIFNSSVGNKSVKQALLDTLKIPMIYAVGLAVLFRGLSLEVYSPAWSALSILGQGLVPTALITLGAQLANTKMRFKIPKVYLSNIMRLLISPVIAYFILVLLGIEGVAAQVIMICAAAPTAVNTVLLAIEFDNEPDYASQTVFSSTVFSAVTVSLVIYAAQLLFKT
ncbi:AEC family transporter [Vallitalea pronyensis]|uniref:AEC family transporter n=1 Tax=Vallitalea pronyensis TaxID=1348613 RepID=A0A8J8SFU8_9FIRM|nr:AEC family transporter [Vallitalea pronyensis]QUI21613.1 AEC family transporter [Vallitalea pronyensis]